MAPRHGAEAPPTAPDGGSRRAAAGAHGALALAAILLVGLAYATMIQSFSWNQTSHYDLIRALNSGQTTIDPYQANTGDKVFYKGHCYSARAPGLALFSLPFYDALNLVGAESLDARNRAAQRGDDEMIYLIGLWGNVLPGLLLLLLVWRVAERFEPGYGAAAAVIARPRHDGAAALDAAVLARVHGLPRLRRVRADAARARRARRARCCSALAGLAMGYAVASEYPLFFVALVLGLYLLSPPRRADARWASRAAPAPTSPAASSGSCRCCSTTTTPSTPGRTSPTPTCRASRKASSGSARPSLKVLATLLFDSRGLLTISPVLMMGALGTVLLYRRGRRAEALTIAGICALLPGLQLRLLPALRRRLHGAALPDHDAAVPGVPARARAQALPRPDDRARRGSRSRRR